MRIACPIRLLLLAVLLWAPHALARGKVDLEGTPAEQEALRSLDANKNIRAREQAEAILARDPDSFLATWVMLSVLHYEEANNPRALHLVRLARERLRRAHGSPPVGARAIYWHKRLLREEIRLLGEMDRPLQQVALLDLYDGLYSPPLKHLRMWPLMKLGRYEEARAVGKELILADEVRRRVAGYNGLMAVADEAHDVRESYRWGKLGLENTGHRSCILGYNTSISAMQVFRFRESEELAKKALEADIKDCVSPGYRRLVYLYLVEGEFQKTISALGELRRQSLDKHLRQQVEMGYRGLLVDLLYVLGRFSEAHAIAGQIFDAPDRTGVTSASKEAARFGEALDYWRILDARLELLRERSSVRPLGARMKLEIDAIRLGAKRWEVGRRAIRLAAHGDLLVTALRPYLGQVAPWAAGSLVRLLGAGVLRQAIGRARALHADLAEESRGYFDAYLGEVAWVSGDLDEAVRLGRSALGSLPSEAALLRWRTTAWLADSLARSGSPKEAAARFHEALRRFPTAFRILGIRLPVAFSDDGSPLARRATGRLRGSRRLREGDLGFAVDARGASGDLEICLRGRGGFRYACAGPKQADPRGGADPEPPKTGDALLLEVLDRFHGKVFAPKVELSQGDINSLDGSPVRVDADQVLDRVLGTGVPGKE